MKLVKKGILRTAPQNAQRLICFLNKSVTKNCMQLFYEKDIFVMSLKNYYKP
jgi:hypothetical protein